MFSQFVRSVVSLLLWIAILGAGLFASSLLLPSHYLGAEQAFELLGYEMRPLGEDKVLGFSAALFPDATLAHFNTLTLTGALAFVSFAFCHCLVAAYTQ